MSNFDKEYQAKKLALLLAGKVFDAHGVAKWLIEEHGYRKQDEVVEDTAEKVLKKVKERLDPTMSALFIIGEILVDESKSHISKEKALDDIRRALSDTMSSRYRLEKMLEEIKEECCVKRID